MRVERTQPTGRMAPVSTPDFGYVDEPFETLSTALWRERELLEKLLFEMTVQQFILLADATRWLANSDMAVAGVADELRCHEIVRSIVTNELTDMLDVPATASLRDIAFACPSPWSVILEEHALSLTELNDEIRLVVRRNEQLMLAGSKSESVSGGAGEADETP